MERYECMRCGYIGDLGSFADTEFDGDINGTCPGCGHSTIIVEVHDARDFVVIIAGGRHFANYALLCMECDAQLSYLAKSYNIIIRSGKASGADSLGEQYAKVRGYQIQEFPANWDEYGKSAGYIRNAEMADGNPQTYTRRADALIAFWDGSSRGTRHMIDIATSRGMLVRVVRY